MVATQSTANAASGDLEQIIWASAAVRPFGPDELQRLLERCRPANQARQITGLLVHHHGSFLQLMEGPTAEVGIVFEQRILRDGRHTDVTVLLRRNAAERNFPDWSMGFVDASHRLLHTLPGFHEFRETTGSFLPLLGDHRVVAAIIDGFHDGRWHDL